MSYAVILFYIIARPKTGFQNIMRNSMHMSGLAVTVFALYCTISVLVVILPNMSNDDVVNIEYMLKSALSTITSSLALIVFVYWMGGRIGGKASWTGVFQVLAFCFIPIMIGGIASAAINSLYYGWSDTLDSDTLVSDGYIRAYLQNIFSLAFIAWGSALFIIAIMLVEKFHVVRAACTYAAAFAVFYLTGIMINISLAILV